MSYKNIVFILFFLLIGVPIHSQNNLCNVAAEIVFNTLIVSIGNNFPSPPHLKISKDEKYVASVTGNEIILEEKALSILCSFPDSESAIAYILSHELAHYYLNHSWMNKTGLSYASTLGGFLNDKSGGLDERKIEETQADVFGGFFSQISGYTSLAIAPEILDELYTEYNLPKELKGYPSLEERKLIIEANTKKVKKLNLIFEAGKLNILTGNYLLAEKCFSHILKEKFTSREIYNNLGSVYLKLAIINSEENISKYMYPVFFENNSRTNIEANTNSRGDDDILSNSDKLIELAMDMFNRSVSLDNGYNPPKINLVLCELIKSVNQGTGSEELVIQNLDKIEDINSQTYFDIVILSKLLFSNKKNKVKKILKKGSDISKYNFEKNFQREKNEVVKSNEIPETHNLIDLEKGKQITGLKKPYEYASSGKGLKVKKKSFDGDILYEINRDSYFVEINNYDYSTSKGIKIGDNVSLIKDKYGKPDEIHKFGNQLYYLYRNNKVVFTSLENKLLKITLYL